MNKSGMNYAPKGKPNPVVNKGEFVFAAIGLDHGHIYGMCNGLLEAGATLKWVYDPDPAKVEAFLKTYEKEGVKRRKARSRFTTIPKCAWWLPPVLLRNAQLWVCVP